MSSSLTKLVDPCLVRMLEQLVKAGTFLVVLDDAAGCHILS